MSEHGCRRRGRVDGLFGDNTMSERKENRKEKIVTLYQSGKTMREVAAEIGCTFQRVQKVLKQEGVERRPRGDIPNTEKHTRAVELYQSGKPISEVALKVGYSYATVWKILRNNGIELRGKRDEKKYCRDCQQWKNRSTDFSVGAGYCKPCIYRRYKERYHPNRKRATAPADNTS